MKKLISFVLCLSMVLSSSMMFGSVVYAAAPTLTFLTEAVYDEMGSLSEGLMWVRNGETDFRFIDETGKEVIPAIDSGFEDGIYGVGDFHEGLANITGNPGEVAFIDKTGKVVLRLEGEYLMNAASYSDGVVVGYTPEEGSTYFFDAKGKGTLVEDDRIYGAHVREGLLDFWTYDYDKDTYVGGFVDKNQKVVIEQELMGVRPFNQGLAPMATEDGWGFIDKTGKFVIAPQFNDFWVHDYRYSYVVFMEGLAAVQKEEDGLWGCIDKSGKTVVDFEWDRINGFVNGYSPVTKSMKFGYVDAKGNVAVEPQFDDANFFNNGIALVGNSGIYWFVDTTGKAASGETWGFESSVVSSTNPQFVQYQKGGKWGLAKIAYEGGTAPVAQPAPAQPAANSVKVLFNGEELQFNLPILNRSSRTFYPMRQLFEAVGADVTWDAATRTASGTLGGNTVAFVIDSAGYTVNGAPQSLENGTAPFLASNSTYIPIRFALEGLGLTVTWDGPNNTIIVE